MKANVKIKALCDEFELPAQATMGSAGFDLRYWGKKEVEFKHFGQVEVLDLGFSMELPEGFEAQIRPRSGLAAKFGVTVLNAPGTIDSDYSGPVKVILAKSGHMDNFLSIKPGDRVCQMVIQKLPQVTFSMVEEIEESERGTGGFGSTGMQ